MENYLGQPWVRLKPEGSIIKKEMKNEYLNKINSLSDHVTIHTKEFINFFIKKNLMTSSITFWWMKVSPANLICVCMYVPTYHPSIYLPIKFIYLVTYTST